jgi:hypothetical protein
LDVRLGELELGRAAIHHHADATAVRFAPSGDAEEVSKRVCHALSLPEKPFPVKLLSRDDLLGPYRRRKRS